MHWHSLSLQALYVVSYRKLKKLPFRSQSNNYIAREIFGNKERWEDGIESEDESTESAFLPHLQAGWLNKETNSRIEAFLDCNDRCLIYFMPYVKDQSFLGLQ